MEEERERLKREQRREARRRRILSNASSRMDKLRGLPIPKSSTADEPEVQETVGAYATSPTAPDPPDELIPRPVQSKAMTHNTNPGGMPLLAHLVTATKSPKGFHWRTAAAVLFALTLPHMTHIVPLFLSYVVCMLLWESLVLLWVTVMAPPSVNVNPLGWLGLIITALMQFHPLFGHVLEGLCLMLYVGGVVLQDLCTMLFFTVISLLLPMQLL